MLREFPLILYSLITMVLEEGCRPLTDRKKTNSASFCPRRSDALDCCVIPAEECGAGSLGSHLSHSSTTGGMCYKAPQGAQCDQARGA